MKTYPPIHDYALIGDCHAAALISKEGSIDWCCMPNFDSPSCFGRLIGWEQGGYYQICPNEAYEAKRNYLKDTMVLETIFQTSSGKVKLIDLFSMKKGGRNNPHRQIIRIVEGISGTMTLSLNCQPSFHYGTIHPWIKKYEKNAYAVMGGNDGLLISGNIPLATDKKTIYSQFKVKKGQRYFLSLIYRRPEELDYGEVTVPTIKELLKRYQGTIAWWQRFKRRGQFDIVYHPDLVLRSALVLKSLANAITGAIAAAPTTSLPESLHGNKNWDYRYSWIRDSFFTVVALSDLGFQSEAKRFRSFIQRSSAGSADQLQVVYGIDGRRDLKEQEVPLLEGYKHIKPVRIGNKAMEQLQLDCYGELLALAWRWHLLGNSPDKDHWDFLIEIIDIAINKWQQADHGIWEFRSNTYHFVYSKVMCWVAVDIGIRLGEELKLKAPYKKWKKERANIRKAIEEKGYDKKRGVFIQAFDRPVMDAALLLLPMFEFVKHDDERIIRTTNEIISELSVDGLLLRYKDKEQDKEGIFLPCTFWLANNLARQGRLQEAKQFFDRAARTANDLGLFSEEYDPEKKIMLGNFPQALTHLSLILASKSIKNPKHHFIL